MSRDLSGLNRAQRRRLERKLEDYTPPTLQEWLSKPGKVVKRGELWNVLHRYWALKELERQWNSPMARFQRLIRRWIPWVDDPPPNPFDPAYDGKDLEEVLSE